MRYNISNHYVIVFVLLTIISCQPMQNIDVLCIGDSITYGWNEGFRIEKHYANRCQELLQRAGVEISFVCSGVPGETSIEGYQRLKEALKDGCPDIVTIMYGTNDCQIDPWSRKALVSIGL